MSKLLIKIKDNNNNLLTFYTLGLYKDDKIISLTANEINHLNITNNNFNIEYVPDKRTITDILFPLNYII
jgi:hypothetical protein